MADGNLILDIIPSSESLRRTRESVEQEVKAEVNVETDDAAQKRANKSRNDVAVGLGRFAAALTALIGALQPLFPLFQALFQLINVLLLPITLTLLPVLSFLTRILARFVQGGDFGRNLIEILRDAFGTLDDILGALVDTLIEKLGNALTRISNRFFGSDTAQATAGFIGGVQESFRDTNLGLGLINPTIPTAQFLFGAGRRALNSFRGGGEERSGSNVTINLPGFATDEAVEKTLSELRFWRFGSDG